MKQSLVLLVLTFLCVGSATATAQAASTPAPGGMTQSAVYPFDQLTAKKFPNGSEGRSVFKGALATGESVAVHESMQPSGTTPGPLHTINHSEMILVQEGTLGFEHDGKMETATAGSIIYVALGTLHRIKNIGPGPARYVVVQIGGDVGK